MQGTNCLAHDVPTSACKDSFLEVTDVPRDFAGSDRTGFRAFEEGVTREMLQPPKSIAEAGEPSHGIAGSPSGSCSLMVGLGIRAVVQAAAK